MYSNLLFETEIHKSKVFVSYRIIFPSQDLVLPDLCLGSNSRYTVDAVLFYMSLSVGLFVYFNLKTAKPQERFMEGQTRLGFENKLVEQKSLNSPYPFESRLYPHTKPNLLF